MRAFSVEKNPVKEDQFITSILSIEPQFRDEQQLKNIELLLKKQPFTKYFSDVSNDSLRYIAKHVKLLKILQNKLFIPKGTFVQRFFIIIEGYLSINYGGLLNNQIKQLCSGDTIGSQSLIYLQQANYNAHTGKEGCVIAYLEQEEFNQSLRLSEMIRIQRYLQAMKKVDLLKRLSEDIILQMYFASNIVELSKKQCIYQLNSPTNGFYLIIQGQAQVYIQTISKNDLSVNYDGSITQRKDFNSSTDSLVMIKKLEQGEFFGHYELIQKQDVRCQTVYSSADQTQVLFLTKGIFWRFFSASISDKSFSIMRNIVKQEENIMKKQNGTFQISQNNDESPKRLRQKFRSIERIPPIGMDILKIISPRRFQLGDISQSQSNTPRQSQINTSKESDKKFLDIIHSQGFATTIGKNGKKEGQYSPLSILRKMKVKELKLSSQVISKDEQTQSFATAEFQSADYIKRSGKSGQDVSTITPFSYDEDYFSKLYQSEQQLIKQTQQQNDGYSPNQQNIISSNQEYIQSSKDNCKESLNLKAQNICSSGCENDTNDVLPSSPLAKELRNQVLKQQTLSDTSEETQLQSQYQLNYLKEQQQKFQKHNLETSINNINLTFNHLAQYKQSFIKNQLTEQGNNRSKSLMQIRQLVNNNTPKTIQAQQNNNDKQQKLLSPHYKVISSMTPMTNTSLIKAEENNQSSINLSPSLRLKLSRADQNNKIVSANTQVQFYDKYNSVIKITSDCNHAGHKRALSQLFIQSKSAVNQNNSNNFNKNDATTILNQSQISSSSFASRFISKMQSNLENNVNNNNNNPNNLNEVKTIYKIKLNDVFKGNNPHDISPSKSMKLHKIYSNGEKIQYFSQKDNSQEPLSAKSISQFIKYNQNKDISPRKANTPIRKQQSEYQSGGTSFKSQIAINIMNQRMKTLYQSNGLQKQDSNSLTGGFTDFLTQNKQII